MDAYQFYEEIGKGSFSTVYKGRLKRSVEFVSIRRVENAHKHKISTEVQAMHSLDHANVLKFHAWFATPNHLWVVTEYCAGAYRAGYDYAEQIVTLTSSGGLVTDMTTGSFALKLLGSGDCGNGTSLAIAPTSTPLELAKAIAGGVGAGLFGGSLPASRVEAFLTGSSETSRTWTVRLYTLSGEDLTGCSDTGAFAAFEPVLSLGDAQATVSVSVATAGVVPSDAMPVDLTLAVAQEGATEAATVEAAEASSLGYVKPLVVVCGDGAYMTAEGCDDGNRISGDGCDANCTVETGTPRAGTAARRTAPWKPATSARSPCPGPPSARCRSTRRSSSKTAARPTRSPRATPTKIT